MLSGGALSLDFVSSIHEALELDVNTPSDFTHHFLFDFGFLGGKSDAKAYKLKLGPKPISSLLGVSFATVATAFAREKVQNKTFRSPSRKRLRQ